MSRTYRKSEDERQPWYTKENKKARKASTRKVRYKTKKALRKEAEVYPVHKNTQGRVSW